VFLLNSYRLTRSLRDSHADTVSGFRVDQIEMNAAPIVLGAVERHGAGDQGEAQMTAPERTLCHPTASRSAHLDAN
jgi:hypothetical protein